MVGVDNLDALYGMQLEDDGEAILRPPEFALWGQMLLLAVNDYVVMVVPSNCSPKRRRIRKVRGESAEGWIFGTAPPSRLRFDDLAGVLGMNPDRVRAALLRDPDAILSRLSCMINRPPKVKDEDAAE